MNNFFIPRKVFSFFLFGAAGICTEIFFTAFHQLFFAFIDGGEPNWSLTGKSYVWMFPIYGSASVFLNLLMPYLRKYHVGFRLLFYPVGIFIVEYISGWLLDMATGKCPWEYHSPYAIHGYINLAYTPLWMAFGLGLELLYNTLQRFKD